jgi:aminoglycoside phosphotransferase (APT) family kinase protein
MTNHSEQKLIADFTVQDNPPSEFIEELRSRFPIEAEMDRVLTRKMRNRSGPEYRRISSEEISAALRNFLSHTVAGPFEISNVTWLNGGVSKLQLAFSLEWRDAGGQRSDRMVVRMDPNEGSNATSRAREFELMKVLKGTIPVPEVYWLDNEAQFFPQPALVYEFMTGVTKPRNSVSGRISGLGTNFGPQLRKVLAPQFIEHLARLHTFDVDSVAFETFERPRTGTTDAALWQYNQSMRTWEEDRAEDYPIMEVAANWIGRNLPVLDRVSVVHGDYRSGNFLYDESTNRFTAWLDWERGQLGDRHRDLAWMTQPAMGHVAEDGRYYVCGLVPLDEFFDVYEQASGLTVDVERLNFYRILNAYTLIVSAMGSGYRVARLGKSHQDIVLTRVEGVVPAITAELHALLAERV